MYIAERSNLIPVKVLISNSLVHIEIFENKKGNLFVSSGTDNPAGIVYYATTPSLFIAFLENNVTLQELFNRSPSVFIEITSQEKTALYNHNDANIILTSGNKTIKELSCTKAIKDITGNLN